MEKHNSATYRMPFRRRREGRTHYRRRIALLKSGKPRLVVRKLNRRIIVQVVKFMPEGDLTLVTVTNEHLKRLGWPAKRNTITAYLMGYYAGKLALSKNIKEVVLDIGISTPTKNSIVFYALKGAIDAGLISNLGVELDESRLKGEHISNFYKIAKEKGLNQFSSYEKNKINLNNLSALFEEVKNKINEGV